MAQRNTAIFADQIQDTALADGLKKNVGNDAFMEVALKANDGLAFDTAEIKVDYDDSTVGIKTNKLAVKDNGIDTLQLALDAVDQTILNLAVIYDFEAGGGDIRIATTPANSKSVVNKEYVDSVASGLQVKDSVRVATLGDITLENTQTIDGIAVNAGDRVLVKEQSSGVENGIYEVVSGGSWTRTADYAVDDEVRSTFMFVEEGSTLEDTGWVCTNDAGSDVVGTDALVYTQFSDAGSFSAGEAIEIDGNTLNVLYDDATVGLNGSNQLEVKDLGIDTAQLANEAVTEGKIDIFNAPTTGYYLQWDTTNGMQWVDIDTDFIKDDDYISNEIPSGTINSINVTFTLANTPINAQSVSVFLNGMFQAQGGGLDYTISGSTITFAKAPRANSDLYVTYIKS